MGIVTFGGGLSFVALNLYNANEKFYNDYVMPVTHRLLDPEQAHQLAVFTMRHRLIRKQHLADPESLVRFISPYHFVIDQN